MNKRGMWRTMSTLWIESAILACAEDGSKAPVGCRC